MERIAFGESFVGFGAQCRSRVDDARLRKVYDAAVFLRNPFARIGAYKAGRYFHKGRFSAAVRTDKSGAAFFAQIYRNVFKDFPLAEFQAQIRQL